MPGPTFFSGDTVALHTVEEADLDAFTRARSDPELRIPLQVLSPENSDTIEEFFEETVSDRDSYWFTVTAGDETVGVVTFLESNQSTGEATLSAWILPEHQGKGFGREAASLLLEYGFDELRFHRISASCAATNDAAQGLLDSLGFVQEGQSREAAFRNGEHVDVVRFGLLAAEWRDI